MLPKFGSSYDRARGEALFEEQGRSAGQDDPFCRSGRRRALPVDLRQPSFQPWAKATLPLGTTAKLRSKLRLGPLKVAPGCLRFQNSGAAQARL